MLLTDSFKAARALREYIDSHKGLEIIIEGAKYFDSIRLHPDINPFDLETNPKVIYSGWYSSGQHLILDALICVVSWGMYKGTKVAIKTFRSSHYNMARFRRELAILSYLPYPAQRLT